jgi:hypothetical protein
MRLRNLRVVLPPGNNGALKASIPLLYKRLRRATGEKNPSPTFVPQKWVTEL